MNAATTHLVGTATHPPDTTALRRAARALGLALLAWSRRPQRPPLDRDELARRHRLRAEAERMLDERGSAATTWTTVR